MPYCFHLTGVYLNFTFGHFTSIILIMISITFIQVACNIDGSERQRMRSAPWQQRARKFHKGYWTSCLFIYETTVVLSILTRAHWLVRTWQKSLIARNVASISKWLVWSWFCADVQTPLTTTPPNRAPQPLREASLNTTLQKDHHWKACILSSPSGSTAIIDSIMPNSCRTIEKRTLHPNWNWVRHLWKLFGLKQSIFWVLERRTIDSGITCFFVKFTEKPSAWMCNKTSYGCASVRCLVINTRAQSPR